MTVVHPNHIVGINSITVQTGDSLSVHKADGSLIRTIVSNTGVSTFHAVEVSKGGGDLNVGVSTFFVDNSAGKVGIGTDIPGQTLHLSAVSGDVYNRVDTNVNGGMLIYVQGTQRSVIANDSAFSGTITDTGIGAKGNLIFRAGTSSYDERLRITSAGLVNIGGAAVSQSRSLNIGSNAEANLAIETHNDATSETANIRFYKSGNTGASPQVVETDDNIAQLIAYGHDGTDYANAAASIKMSVDGAPGGNDMPGKIIFSTNAGGTSASERLRITAAGKIGIGHHSGSQITHELTIRPANDGGISIKRPGDTIASPNTHLDITTTTSGSAFPSGEAYTVKYKTNNSDQIFETYAGGGTGGNISFRTSTSNNSNESLRITPNSHVLPGADNTQNFGSSTLRWANVYTGDLQLSNEGKTNEVDGSWGTYTIQEGESDLFLINRRNGKKYKFNLTEVS